MRPKIEHKNNHTYIYKNKRNNRSCLQRIHAFRILNEKTEIENILNTNKLNLFKY